MQPRNRIVVQRFAVRTVFLVLSSLMRPDRWMETAMTFAALAAAFCALIAVLMRESVRSPTLNHWDEFALFSAIAAGLSLAK